MDYDSDEELQQLIRARAEKEKKAVSAKPPPQPTPAVGSEPKEPKEGGVIKNGSVSSSPPAGEPERPKRKGPAPILESHTGLQLVARKTSSDDLDRLCGGRQVVGVSGLGTMDEATIEGADFVLIGVLVVRSDRTSSSGGKYSLWTLSDLSGHSVELYLFGDAAGAGQSVQAGMVVSVVCPKALPRRGSGAARHFSITNHYQIFQIGYASDFASCGYMVKHGHACGRAFNRKQGIFCAEHVRLHAEKNRQAHPSSPWLLPSNLTTAPPPRKGGDNGHSTYTVASSALSGGMTAAGTKRPTTHHGTADNKLLKKLKREHDVIRVLKDGPSASTVAEYKAKAAPPAPAPMLLRKPVSSSSRLQSNLISHRRPTPPTRTLGPAPNASHASTASTASHTYTASNASKASNALSARTLAPRPLSSSGGQGASGASGGGVSKPSAATTPSHSSSSSNSINRSSSSSHTSARPTPPPPTSHSNQRSSEPRQPPTTITTTSSSNNSGVAKEGSIVTGKPVYVPNRPQQPTPSLPLSAAPPTPTHKPVPPPSSSSSQPSSQKASTSAPPRPPIAIVSSKPRSHQPRDGPASVTVKGSVGETVVLPLTSLAKREPLSDLMDPHRRIWLDEEERARSMSGSVHKPLPSVLLTRGADTLVQQAHLARVEARRLAAQAEAEEARQQKNAANKAAILRAMQNAGHRNRNPAQYRPTTSALTSFRDLAPSSSSSSLASANGASSLKSATSSLKSAPGGVSMLRPLGTIAKKGPTPAPAVTAPRGVSMISAELTGGVQANQAQQPKQLGGLSAEERAELMNAKSRHHDTHKEELKRQLESVLGRMEEREAKIDKMRTITSKKVEAFHCAQCDEYREGFHPVCGREGHKQTKKTVVKRLFACRMCDHPTFVLHFNLPKHACTKCGEMSWVKGSLAGNANKCSDGPNRLVLAVTDWTRPEDMERLYAN